MSEQRPLIVYVSGPPGSGKTTLASKISHTLYIPHISSDLVHAGVRLTEGEPISIAQLIANAKEGRMSDGIAVLLAYDELMKLEGEK